MMKGQNQHGPTPRARTAHAPSTGFEPVRRLSSWRRLPNAANPAPAYAAGRTNSPRSIPTTNADHSPSV
jgi:hypothetical protein